MILPLTPSAIIALPASWMPTMTPSAFTSMILCQTASVASRNGSGLLKPALFTITLIVPNSRRQASTAARTEVRSVTSMRWKTALLPCAAAISRAAAVPLASSRSAITIENPSAARPAAIARPMPLAEPVTTAPPSCLDAILASSIAIASVVLGFAHHPVDAVLRQVERCLDGLFQAQHGVDLLAEDVDDLLIFGDRRTWPQPELAALRHLVHRGDHGGELAHLGIRGDAEARRDDAAPCDEQFDHLGRRQPEQRVPGELATLRIDVRRDAEHQAADRRDMLAPLPSGVACADR